MKQSLVPVQNHIPRLHAKTIDSPLLSVFDYFACMYINNGRDGFSQLFVLIFRNLTRTIKLSTVMNYQDR